MAHPSDARSYRFMAAFWEGDRRARSATPDRRHPGRSARSRSSESPMSQSGFSAETPAEPSVQSMDRDRGTIANVAGPGAASSDEGFDSLARQLFLAHPLPMWVCD